MGGTGSLVSFWTWPALVAACARGRLCALVLTSAGGWGGGSPLVVHRGQDAEVAVGDRDASAHAGVSAASPCWASCRSLPKRQTGACSSIEVNFR